MNEEQPYKIKIEVFEGPFALLCHLIEKNKIDIYDIPISVIADQYMDYLFSMTELNLDIASEFLVMASTLLRIKSRLLLPVSSEAGEEQGDPRDELVISVLEYKKYKDIAQSLKNRNE
jgi:segregation and condensation protein A